MTHLDESMSLADLDPTAQDTDELSLPRRILARIPELEGTRARLADQLFGVTLPAARIGRFRLLEKLGEGGMGRVYAAHDDALDRRVAVKLLHSERGGDGRARMLREAQALARLSHPNVVQVFEVGEHDDQIYAAMELVPGHDLARWLTGERRPWRTVLAIYLAAGAGLQAAHAAGLVHRDFKPANVIVGDDGRARVVDFGLARASELAAEASPARLHVDLAAALTMTGALHGTPVYLAPEVLRGRRADARADQYAFCVALYEGLYGARPHRAETLGDLTAAKLRGDVEPPPADARVPAWLHAALLRGLSVDPGRRWPSMHALLAELGRDRSAARRRIGALAAGLVLVGVAGLAGLRAYQSRTAAELAEAAVASEQARARAAEDAAELAAREHALVLRVRASEAAIRRAQDLSGTPARAREAAVLAAAALRDARTTHAPTTAALRALVTALAAPRLTAELRAPGSLRSAHFAADEAVIVTHGLDWSLRLWDAATREPLATLPRIHAVQIDPAGALVTVGDDGLARRDPRTGAVTQHLGPGEHLLELSADGHFAAVAHGDTVDVYDLESARKLATLPGAAHVAAFSTDGRRLVTGRGGTAYLWSVPDGRSLGHLPTRSHGAFGYTRVAISPDGTRVAVAGNDDDIHLWDTAGVPRRLPRAVGHTHTTFVLRFAADGRALLSAGGDGQVFLWDPDDARVLVRLQSEQSWWFLAASLSPDGQRIAAADAQGVLRVWSARTGELLTRFASDRGEFTDLRHTADGQRILTAAASGAASVWSFPRNIPATAAIAGPILDADLHPSTDRVALLNPDGAVTLQTLGRDPAPLRLTPDDPARKYVRLSRDAATLLTVTTDGLAELWDADTGRPRCSLPSRLHAEGPSQFAHASAAAIVAVTDDDAVRSWSSADCRELAELTPPTSRAWFPWVFGAAHGPSPIGRGDDGLIVLHTHGPHHKLIDTTGAAPPLDLDLGKLEVQHVDFSPDGAQVAIVGRNGLARVFDATSGAELGQLAGLDGFVTGVRYAPDGATLLTLGGGHAAHLWRASDRALLTRLELADSPARAAWSADGSRLLIADTRGEVGLWDARAGEFAGVLARLDAPPRCIGFSADDADVLLAGPVHGAIRVPATAAGVLAVGRPLLGE